MTFYSRKRGIVSIVDSVNRVYCCMARMLPGMHCGDSLHCNMHCGDRLHCNMHCGDSLTDSLHFISMFPQSRNELIRCKIIAAYNLFLVCNVV